MARKIAAILLAGPIWWIGVLIFFVFSGAQGLLANPEYQSEKFIQVFAVVQPLPRAAQDPAFIWIGMLIIGVFPALVFLYLNKLLAGNWWQKGLKYGLIHWALVTPWFEFYLPYNVMHEPLPLVLFETGLWLGVALMLGLALSLLVNFRAPDPSHI